MVTGCFTLKVVIPLGNTSQLPEQGDEGLCSQNKPMSELKQGSGLAEQWGMKKATPAQWNQLHIQEKENT